MHRIQTAILGGCIVASAISTAVAQTSGPLNVSTSVSATCLAPNPSGTLILPFDAAEFISSQPDADPVEVTITCSGGASVSKVAFDDGLHSAVGDFGSDTIDHRVLKLDSGDGGDACFSYMLFASGTETGSYASINPEALGGGENEVTSFSGTSFWVKGSIGDGAVDEGSGACTHRIEDDEASVMDGGTYRDTVTMTVSF